MADFIQLVEQVGAQDIADCVLEGLDGRHGKTAGKLLVSIQMMPQVLPLLNLDPHVLPSCDFTPRTLSQAAGCIMQKVLATIHAMAAAGAIRLPGMHFR